MHVHVQVQWNIDLFSLVPRPFPFLRALGTPKHKRKEKFEKQERPGTISHVR